MTVSELKVELQKLEEKDMGEATVFISDFSETDNPVPQMLYFVRPRFNCRKVFLESEYKPYK